jgi:hypothetical protein
MHLKEGLQKRIFFIITVRQFEKLAEFKEKNCRMPGGGLWEC